jgi:hypothetical protein
MNPSRRVNGVRSDNRIKAFFGRFAFSAGDANHTGPPGRILIACPLAFHARKSGINLRLQGARGTLAATQPARFVKGFLQTLTRPKSELRAR